MVRKPKFLVLLRDYGQAAVSPHPVALHRQRQNWVMGFNTFTRTQKQERNEQRNRNFTGGRFTIRCNTD